MKKVRGERTAFCFGEVAASFEEERVQAHHPSYPLELELRSMSLLLQMLVYTRRIDKQSKITCKKIKMINERIHKKISTHCSD